MDLSATASDDLVPFVGEQVTVLSDLVRHVFDVDSPSLTVIGRAATAQFNEDIDPIRTVLVIDAIDLRKLIRLAEHGPRLGAQRVVAPLIMTPTYIAESLDTFALELIEIHQRHVTVLGQDYFVNLSFDEKDVRLQCERELKVLAIQLRQGLLAAGGREQSLAELEIGVTEGLLRTLRGMLWLKNIRGALPDDAVLTRIEELTHRPLEGARIAMNDLSGHGYKEFEALYGDVVHLSSVVNAW